MNSWSSFLIVERLGWTLLHSLWQFTCVALVMMFLMRLFQRYSSSARYTLSALALVVVALTGPLTFILTAPVRIEKSVSTPDLAVTVSSRVAASPATNVASEVAETVHLEVPVQWDSDAESTPAVAGGRMNANAEFTMLRSFRSWQVWFDGWLSDLQLWLPIVVGVWSLGVLILSFRPLFAWLAIHRLRTKGITSVSDQIVQIVDETARRMGIRRSVEVVQSSLVQVPSVVGWLKPLILLPASVATGLSADQLEGILVHELAHIRRQDFVVNVLQTLVETVFFYHPAVWWISHVMRLEREDCCDDWAIALCSDRTGYAKSLVTLEELRGKAPAIAMSASGGSLLNRIRRILGAPPKHNSSWSLGFCGMAFTLCIAIGVSLIAWPQTTEILAEAKKRLPERVNVKSSPYLVVVPKIGTVQLLGLKRFDAAQWQLADGRIADLDIEAVRQGQRSKKNIWYTWAFRVRQVTFSRDGIDRTVDVDFQAGLTSTSTHTRMSDGSVQQDYRVDFAAPKQQNIATLAITVGESEIEFRNVTLRADNPTKVDVFLNGKRYDLEDEPENRLKFQDRVGEPGPQSLILSEVRVGYTAESPNLRSWFSDRHGDVTLDGLKPGKHLLVAQAAWANLTPLQVEIPTYRDISIKRLKPLPYWSRNPGNLRPQIQIAVKGDELDQRLVYTFRQPKRTEEQERSDYQVSQYDFQLIGEEMRAIFPEELLPDNRVVKVGETRSFEFGWRELVESGFWISRSGEEIDEPALPTPKGKMAFRINGGNVVVLAHPAQVLQVIKRGGAADSQPTATDSDEGDQLWFWPDPFPALGHVTIAGDGWRYLRIASFPMTSKEIGTDEKQRTALNSLWAATQKGSSEIHRKHRESGDSTVQDWTARRVQLWSSAADVARGILTEEQDLRVQQLRLQRMSYNAFGREDIAERIDLSAKQRQQIKQAIADHINRIRGKDSEIDDLSKRISSGLRGLNLTKRVDELKQLTDARGPFGRRSHLQVWLDIHDVLSAEQRLIFNKLRGEIPESARNQLKAFQFSSVPKREVNKQPAQSEQPIPARENKVLEVSPKPNREVGQRPKVKTSNLPADLLQRLHSFPEQTETFVVCNSPTNVDRLRLDLKASWTHMLMGEVPQSLSDFLLKHGVGRLVKGGCNYQVVSAFGSYRCEGATIYELRKPLAEPADALYQHLGDQQLETRQIGGRKVIAMPVDRNSRETVFKDLPWEGRFFTVIDANTIIIASSDRYLEELLKRWDSKPVIENLYRRFELLSRVDAKDSNWLVRQVPQTDDERVTGVETFVRASLVKLHSKVELTDPSIPVLEAVYLPRVGLSLGSLKSHVRRYLQPRDGPLNPAFDFREENGELNFTFGLGPALSSVDQKKDEKLGLFFFTFPYMQQGLY